MWTFVQERGPWLHYPTHIDIEPRLLKVTVRQARWCWRVHLAAPDIFLLDAYGLAQNFSFREQARDVLAVPLEVDDLEAILAYRSWTGPGANKRYADAIKSERIRPVPKDRTSDVDLANRIGDVKNEIPIIGVGSETLGILFSQILDLRTKVGDAHLYLPVDDPDLFGALAGSHLTTPPLRQLDAGLFVLSNTNAAA